MRLTCTPMHAAADVTVLRFSGCAYCVKAVTVCIIVSAHHLTLMSA